MRIGIITPGYSQHEDEWAIPVLRHLVRRLSERHELTVFTLRYPPRPATYSVDGVKVVALGGGTVGGFGRFPLYRQAGKVVCSAEPFDLLHAFWADEPGFVAVRAARRLQLPAVVSVFGGELVNMPDIAYGGAVSRVNRVLTRYALRRASVVTAGSQYVGWMAEAVAPNARIVQWSQGVNAPPTVQPNNTGNLLHVGALTPIKDQKMLLDAFARIVTALPDVQLTIVGDGRLRGELERYAGELGIARRVAFLGRVPHEQMGAAYRSADLLLLTSRHESQGMVLLEAIAHGCAVTGTRVGLVPELAPAELTADPRDAAALARSAIRLLTNEHERRALFGFQSAELQQKYTLDVAVEQIEELYEGVCTL